MEDTGEGFVNFYFFRPDSTEQEPKISYNKIFEPYNWFIGTGEYEREIAGEIQLETIRRLREIRYDEDGYLYIYDSQGTMIMHPILPEMEGNNYYNLNDASGKNLFTTLLESSQAKETHFVDYLWSHPGLGENMPKVAYAQYVEEWDWMVGSGLYMHRIDEIIREKRRILKNEINENIRSILILVVLTMLTGAVFIQIYSNYLKKSFNLFSSFFEKASTENAIIDNRQVNYREFKKLSLLANRMLESRTEIQKQLSDSMHDLEKARDEAESATRAKSDFLANMSHEVRTPMNAIFGLSHLMQKTELSEKQNDYIQKIYGAAHNLLGIINDILDFSKIEAGKLIFEKINFNLQDVFYNLGSIIGAKAQAKELELIFHIGTDIPMLLIGDPLRLGQVLLNLSNNAIKFTASGEIEVKVELVKEDQESIELLFGIRDTGVGLTEDQMRKLFQAFTQADTSTTRKFGGTGLGLSISKRLVEIMGGRIGVNSTYTKGSTFYFSALLGVQKVEQRSFSSGNLNKLSVLVIDDNETSRSVLSDYLEDFSFDVLTAGDCETASDIIKDNIFDLILIDYHIPCSNGYNTLERIQGLIPAENPVKYILMTDIENHEIMEKFSISDFDNVLTKPVSQSALFDSIMCSFGIERIPNYRDRCSEQNYNINSILGARILLAEDNEINQQVAREILESEGFFVDIANNGREAVTLAEKTDYDIILMDLQMPVLDGYSATIEIRSIYDQEDLPIIAMTADAMTGVRDRVIESGMNDYITKPVDTQKLWNALLKWIKPAERILPEDYFPLEEAQPSGDKFPSVEGIDTESGLKRIGGNTELYRKLLNRFIDDYSDVAEKISSLYAEDEIEEAVREAHSLKGVSANLGAGELQVHMAEIETILKNGEDPGELLETSEMIIGRLVIAIRRSGAIPGAPGREPGPKTISGEVLALRLNDAVDSLSRRKPKPAVEVLDELATFDLPEDTGIKIKEARNLLAKYKMKEAREILERLS